ncbi:MAG: D-2-hydroxyacid dehydrogenase [Clostridia bacterium]|nr:D-2-hydroxyacid dehydrogenase [Clostridia bacterium]
MQIVILDGYCVNPGDVDWGPLRALGTVSVYDRTHPDMIAQRLRGADAVFVNKVRLNRDAIFGARQLKFIGVLATGYDVIDLNAAKERGIVVTNVPAYSTEAVAQHAISLLLALCQHVEYHAALVRQGAWTASPDFAWWKIAPTLLSGKTMGIVGCGRIGSRVAKIADALGMRVLGYNPEMKSGFVGTYVSLDKLLRESDVVSLHCPAKAETVGLIRRDTIAKMKDGALLINTARGSLISETDVCEALASGKLAGYAADVASEEPIRLKNPLMSAPNCLITSHYAWTPKPMRQTIIDVSAENLSAFLSGKPINVVG